MEIIDLITNCEISFSFPEMVSNNAVAVCKVLSRRARFRRCARTLLTPPLHVAHQFFKLYDYKRNYLVSLHSL